MGSKTPRDSLYESSILSPSDEADELLLASISTFGRLILDQSRTYKLSVYFLFIFKPSLTKCISLDFYSISNVLNLSLNLFLVSSFGDGSSSYSAFSKCSLYCLIIYSNSFLSGTLFTGTNSKFLLLIKPLENFVSGLSTRPYTW